MKKPNVLVMAYDRTTIIDTLRDVAKRQLDMEACAKEMGLEVTKHITDGEPRNFSEQRELHKLLDFARNIPKKLVLIAPSPYRLIKAGLKVMLPILGELCETAASLTFVDQKSIGACQGVRWANEVQSEIARERSAIIIATRKAHGRPRLVVNIGELRQHVQRHGLRRAARMAGISHETARKRLKGY